MNTNELITVDSNFMRRATAERESLLADNMRLREACKKALTCGLDSSVREIVLAALRSATPTQENQMNREIETGVSWNNRWQAWYAGSLDGTRNVPLGEGDSEEEAIEDLLQKEPS